MRPASSTSWRRTGPRSASEYSMLMLARARGLPRSADQEEGEGAARVGEAQDPQRGLCGVAATAEADRGVVRRGEGLDGTAPHAAAHPRPRAGTTADDGARAEPQAPRQNAPAGA